LSHAHFQKEIEARSHAADSPFMLHMMGLTDANQRISCGCNSEFRDQVQDSPSYLERYSLKGSCHCDKSSMNHNHCEF
jgi:hypothetical protein